MRPPLLCLCLLSLVALTAAAGPDPYTYDYGYGDGYGDDSLSYLDDYGYFGSDDDAYYEEYGTYADHDYDAFGYDDYDYLDYGTSASSSCTADKDGKVKLSNGTASCDIKLSGADKMADKLKSGIDGVYKIVGCHNGHAMYKRKDSPAGEDRVLWYSKGFQDWDLSKGVTPNEKDILMYGTDIHGHGVPLFVQSWHLGADLTTKKPNGTSDESYIAIKLTVTCADGKVVKPPPVTPAQQKVGPILTDDEMEQKYKLIYEKYGRRPEPNPNVSFSFVIMLVMIGLTIVLAIPYMLVKRSGKPSGKGYQPVATNFAQVIQQSKKKHSGHDH